MAFEKRVQFNILFLSLFKSFFISHYLDQFIHAKVFLCL